MNMYLSLLQLFIFSKSWHGSGYADRISSMDTAQLSQCSWSVIEKVITAREIKLRKFRAKAYVKKKMSGIEYSMGRTISKDDIVPVFLCIRDIIERVKIELWIFLCREDKG